MNQKSKMSPKVIPKGDTQSGTQGGTQGDTQDVPQDVPEEGNLDSWIEEQIFQNPNFLCPINVLKARTLINPTRSEVPCGVGTEIFILRAGGTLLC